MKDRHTPDRYVANINGPGPLGVDRETFVGAGRRGGECNSAARWLSKYLKACSRTRHSGGARATSTVFSRASSSPFSAGDRNVSGARTRRAARECQPAAEAANDRQVAAA